MKSIRGFSQQFHDRQLDVRRISIGGGSIRFGVVLGGAMGVLLGFVFLAGHPGLSYGASAGAGEIAQDGSAERGRSLFGVYCSICHSAAGIPVVFGPIGPDLTDFQSRPLIAGVVPNTPGNLARWLAYPQGVKPDTAMPRLGLSAAEVNDLAAFLLPWQEPTPGEETGVSVGDRPSATDSTKHGLEKHREPVPDGPEHPQPVVIEIPEAPQMAPL